MNKTPEARTVPAKYIFIDVDDFTLNRSVEAQSDIIRALNSIVKTITKDLGITPDDVLFLPRGDGLGVALLNIESPYDIHLSIALKIVREVSRYSRSRSEDQMRQFKVRVGIDANIDSLITDINGNRNIAGAGVNIAHSVMNLADGNQILVSDPVFESLSRHEKYILSFKNFRAKIKHGLELPVHQFIEAGHEGLDISMPESLVGESPLVRPRAAAKIETAMPSTPLPTLKPENPSRVGKVEFEDKKSKTVSTLPATSPAIVIPGGERESVQTHSYLTGILNEQAKSEVPRAETKTSPDGAGGWIKPKPQSIDFLEQVTPDSGNNRMYLTAGLVVLLLAVAGFGAWIFTNSNNSSVESVSSNSTAPETASNSVAKTPTVAPTTAPVAVENETASKSNQTFTPPNQTAVTENKTVAPTVGASTPVATERRTVSVSNSGQSRRANVVRRTPVAAASSPAPIRATAKPATPKRQTARDEKPKSGKKVTLDDLLGGSE